MNILIFIGMLIFGCFLVKAMVTAFIIDFGIVQTYVTPDGELNLDGRGLPVNLD